MKIIITFLALIALVFVLNVYLADTVNHLFEIFQSQKGEVIAYYENNKLITVLLFCLFYILSVVILLPLATPLTVVSGAIFGVPLGYAVSAFSSVVGATLVMVLVRKFFGDYIIKKYNNKFKIVREGFEKEGGLYLFSLRVLPLWPFLLTNILMGCLPISVRKYVIVSFIGMFPGTLLYVYLGKALSEITSLGDLVSFKIVALFTLLAVLPIIIKKLLIKLDIIKGK